ncbi:CinA family nicotinamide mononucleotide deamidase-related protein [bacterium]|nr:CinA family nicotinamide mononucleotide deamidase-related protein [bacterium]
MNLFIISVGNELVSGRTVDTNSNLISKSLSAIGVETVGKISVPDEKKAIKEAIQFAIGRADAVIITGGLGPTPDDVTVEAISEFLGEKLVFHKDVLDSIREHFDSQGLVMPENNIRQAYLPESATPIPNNVGTAPGLFIKKDGKRIFAIPGFPSEMEAMLNGFIIPKLSGTEELTERFESFSTAQVPESQILTMLEKKLSKSSLKQIRFYPSYTGINLQVPKETAPAVRELLSDYIVANGEKKLEQVIGEILRTRGQTLSVAESCSGGMLASRIVSVSGSSDYFLAGIVSYSNEAKKKLLGVREETLRKFGAVSPETAAEMAEGARKIHNCDFALSTTGIAGPTGGTREKPVGLVYIGLATKEGWSVRRYFMPSERNIFRLKTTQAALNILWVYLTGRWGRYKFLDGSEEI